MKYLNLLALVAAAVAVSVTEAGLCSTRMNLVFAIDKSASIKSNHWKLEKKFLKSMINAFEIAENRVRVGLTLFAVSNHHKLHLNEIYDQRKLIEFASRLSCKECKNGKTATGAALKHVKESSLTAAHGARPDAENVVVVLTDGRSTEEASFLQLHANNLKKVASVFAIGVGKIDKKELELIASSAGNVFTAKKFSQLAAITSSIAAKVCKAISPPITPTLVAGPSDPTVFVGTKVTLTCQTETKGDITYTILKNGEPVHSGSDNTYTIASASAADIATYSCKASKHGVESGESNKHALKVMDKCHEPIDLLFLMDKSASIKQYQFVIAKKFVEKMVGNFKISPTVTRVGVALFAIEAHDAFCFNKHTTLAAVQKAVLALSCPKCKRGKTGTGAGLELGRTKYFKAACGSRPDAKKIVVVLTDGKSTEAASFLSDQVKLMKGVADQIITIGVGKIKMSELKMIATGDDLVFTTDDFSKLEGMMESISMKTCLAGTA